MTPGLRKLLERVNGVQSHGVCFEPSNDRSTAVRLKLIVGRPMKVGHGKIYNITAEGRRALETGKLP